VVIVVPRDILRAGSYGYRVSLPYRRAYLPPRLHISVSMITPMPEWEGVISLFQGGGTLYLLGKSDTGKSSFCRYLIERFAPLSRIAYLDGDTGQSTIGSPATAGLAIYDGDPVTPVATGFRFIGDVSPRGHLLQGLTALKRLQAFSRQFNPWMTVIDSPGYVSGEAAREYQFSQIEILRPDHLVAIQERGELEEILALFRSHPAVRTHRFRVSPAVRKRSREWRTRYRMERFSQAFAGAHRQEIDTMGIGFHGRLPLSFRDPDWEGLLIGLCDADHFLLTPGIVEHVDPVRGLIRVFAPDFDPERLASVQVGAIRLDRERWV
jgi:polynucleotide 5'-kinase involved in rRNA processing